MTALLVWCEARAASVLCICLVCCNLCPVHISDKMEFEFVASVYWALQGLCFSVSASCKSGGILAAFASHCICLVAWSRRVCSSRTLANSLRLCYQNCGLIVDRSYLQLHTSVVVEDYQHHQQQQHQWAGGWRCRQLHRAVWHTDQHNTLDTELDTADGQTVQCSSIHFLASRSQPSVSSPSWLSSLSMML